VAELKCVLSRDDATHVSINDLAYIRALLPDLVKFAYTPKNQHSINGDAPRHQQENSPDFLCESTGSAIDAEEHVLVLEFVESSKGKKHRNQALV